MVAQMINKQIHYLVKFECSLSNASTAYQYAYCIQRHSPWHDCSYCCHKTNCKWKCFLRLLDQKPQGKGIYQMWHSHSSMPWGHYFYTNSSLQFLRKDEVMNVKFLNEGIFRNSSEFNNSFTPSIHQSRSVQQRRQPRFYDRTEW